MSTSEHQTRLSLRLRKRNQERSGGALPSNKKQAKVITDGTGTRQDLSAFGAPMDEDRMFTKRSADQKPTTANHGLAKKQKTLQSNIKDVLNQSSSTGALKVTKSKTTEINVANTSEKADDLHEHLPSTNQKTHTIIPTLSSTTTTQTTKKVSEQHSELRTEEPETNSALPKATPATEKTIDRHEDLPAEKFKTCMTNPTTEATTTMTTASASEVVARGTSCPTTLQSPSRSPTEDNSFLLEDSPQFIADIGSLPSPMATPETKRTAKMIATDLAPPSPSTKPHVNTAIPPSFSTHLHGKSLLPKLEKERIADEQRTLDKLVSALDITLTFHAARNVAAFFHKIQPMLRNSTKKNITISHLCKILFVAPELYDVETKLLKEYGKDVEAHQIGIGHNWKMPLSGKMMQERKDLMAKRSGDYYEKHKEGRASIPEAELPSMDKVVDKKKWLAKAKLPDRVRSILELQEKRKAAKEEKASQPRIEQKGTAKDRANALLERIRNKQKK